MQRVAGAQAAVRKFLHAPGESFPEVIAVPAAGRLAVQAKPLVAELADRLGPPTGAGRGDRTSAVPSGGWQGDVAAGLTSLGWSAREADQAVLAIAPDVVAAATSGTTPDVGALLKAALRTLDRP